MQTIPPSEPNPPFAAPTQSRRAKLLATAITSLALLAAGCGASSPNNSNADVPASFTAAAFKYSSCMRDHGLSSFPDPMMTDHDGQQVAYLTATIPAHPSPAFKSAQTACQRILPPPINVSPSQLAQQRQAREQHLLTFAECLRNHGIPNFPDPTSQGRLTPAMVNTAGVDLHAPTVLSAATICLGTTDGAITAADMQRALDDTQ